MSEEEQEEVADTEETESETEQEAAESEQEAEETPEQTESSEPRQPTDEVKVVLVCKGNRTMVGIQAPNCDPILTPIDGGIEAALPHVPALIEAANARWDTNPRNPAAVMPEPEPRPEPARRIAAPAPRQTSQPSFF